MTTPTREQALTPTELRELCAQLSEDGQAMLHRAVHSAHMSGLVLGREQGLREAKEVCDREASFLRSDKNGASTACEICAAAIDKLRTKP